MRHTCTHLLCLPCRLHPPLRPLLLPHPPHHLPTYSLSVTFQQGIAFTASFQQGMMQNESVCIDQASRIRMRSRMFTCARARYFVRVRWDNQRKQRRPADVSFSCPSLLSIAPSPPIDTRCLNQSRLARINSQNLCLSKPTTFLDDDHFFCLSFRKSSSTRRAVPRTHVGGILGFTPSLNLRLKFSKLCVDLQP